MQWLLLVTIVYWIWSILLSFPMISSYSLFMKLCMLCCNYSHCWSAASKLGLRVGNQ